MLQTWLTSDAHIVCATMIACRCADSLVAQITCEGSDEDEDERGEKQQLEAEQLVEQLAKCEDVAAEADKENRPPNALRSFAVGSRRAGGATDGRRSS